MRSALRCLTCLSVLLAAGCVHKAQLIPNKAMQDMQCATESLTVMELGGGEEGAHLVTGCGKKATYELNPLGDWVLTGPVTQDPTYITPQTAE